MVTLPTATVALTASTAVPISTGLTLQNVTGPVAELVSLAPGLWAPDASLHRALRHGLPRHGLLRHGLLRHALHHRALR